MSIDAPWLALSVDWQSSPMFDEATHGERLAWVCLLCHAKSQGRGGRVRLRKNEFQSTYRLSERAVTGMLEKAQKCGAAEVNGDFVSLCNWDSYQGKASSARSRVSRSFQEKTATCVLGAGEGTGGGKSLEGGPGETPEPGWLAALWARWLKHKHERRDKKYTDSAEGIQKRRLIRGGLEFAQEAVDHSIGNNYAGLFHPRYGDSLPPKGDTGRQARGQPTNRRAAKSAREHAEAPLEIPVRKSDGTLERRTFGADDFGEVSAGDSA